MILDPGYPPQRIHYSICKTPATCSGLVLSNSLPCCKKQMKTLVYYSAPFQGKYFLTAFWTRISKNTTFQAMNQGLDLNLYVLCHCCGANSSTGGSRTESSALCPAQAGVTRSLLAFMVIQHKLLKYFSDYQTAG